MLKNISIIFLSFILFQSLKAQELTCSRTATVNYQSILVENGPNKKGEGLRYYLDRDPQAKKNLDLYQEIGAPNWHQAAIGSIGTILIISGLAKTGSFSEGGFASKRSLVLSGALIMAVNFLVVKTIEYNNERLLIQAIEEYNRKNLPRIYLGPQKDIFNNNFDSNSWGLSLGVYQNF
jgi:hypothetical protein